MNSQSSLASAWNLTLPLLIVCAVVVVAYLAFYRLREPRRAALFVSGVLLALVAWASPLDALAVQYLLSAQVIICVTVTLVAPLLLVAGIPSMPEKGGAVGFKYEAYLGWIAGMVVIAVWYAAPLFNAALTNVWARGAQRATSVLAGAAFWWPIFTPWRSRRIKPVPTGVWYLFGATIWCSILGLFLAFAEPDLYRPYSQPKDTFRILETLQDNYKLTRVADQQTGGLLFWIGSMGVLLCAVMLMFYRWYTSKAMRDEFRPGRVKKTRENQA